MKHIYRKLVPKNVREGINIGRGYLNMLKSWLSQSNIKDYKEIPIVINNFNHLIYLLSLIHALEKRGYKNIIILDNNSNYPPLLEYYKTCPYRIEFLNKNLGYLALSKSSVYEEIKHGYYVYTDPDIVPIDECPDDFLLKFLEILKSKVFLHKVGFSLKIDDIPNHYDKKEVVINWEKNFYKNEVTKGVFKAQIDTTFALHRPGSKISFLDGITIHYRLNYPYQARHLPWYENSNELSDELKHYYKNAVIGNHW